MSRRAQAMKGNPFFVMVCAARCGVMADADDLFADIIVHTCAALGDDNTKEVPLRPLTSLKWPYVPEESTYPDPLKRDDPKPLQTAQYEAIGSPTLFFFTRPASLLKKERLMWARLPCLSSQKQQ